MTQFYIGCKQIEAWPQEKDGKPGYAVKYSDGYTSWSPKEIFDKAYLPMGHKEDFTDDDMGKTVVNCNKITQEMVDDFISDVTCHTLDKKTTVVKATLVNGFVIVDSSSCVDPENYCGETGKSIALGRIKGQVWLLLGFLLQTARNGVICSRNPKSDP